MGFDARNWPNAVTVGHLIAQGMPLAVHCNPCGRFAKLDPPLPSSASVNWMGECAVRTATLPIAATVLVPSLEGRFRCGRCGSRDTQARPEYGAPSKPDPEASLVVR